MIGRLLTGMAALGWLVCASAAMADDPNDPAMRSKAARARDHEIIRQLNLRELSHVRERDAGYARQWRAWDAQQDRRADHERAMERYRDQQQRYQRDMAAWRRAVAACRDGDYRACQR